MSKEIKSVYSYIVFDFGKVKLKVDSANNAYLIDKSKPGILLSIDYTVLKEYISTSEQLFSEVESMSTELLYK